MVGGSLQTDLTELVEAPLVGLAAALNEEGPSTSSGKSACVNGICND